MDIFLCFCFQEEQSSLNRTATPLPRPLTQAKKWAGGSQSIGQLIRKPLHILTLSQINLLLMSTPQCVRSRGWHFISKRQQWVGRCGATAGGEAQGADEGSDAAKDVRHAVSQSYDREAGEGGRRVRINKEALWPKWRSRSKHVNINTILTFLLALEIRLWPK